MLHMIEPHSAGRSGRLLVDFDLTLFRTDAFAGDLWQEMATQSGRPVTETEEDGKNFHLDPVLGGYDFHAHIDSYGLSRDVLWKRLDELVRSKDYLYPDAAPFIQALQGAGYSPSILSYGENQYQSAKIVPVLAKLAGFQDGTTENESLSYDVVFQKKGQYIAATYPGEQGVLVDDVPGQNLPGGFVEIQLDRQSGLATPQEKVGGFVVANLEQAYSVIRDIHG